MSRERIILALTPHEAQSLGALLWAEAEQDSGYGGYARVAGTINEKLSAAPRLSAEDGAALREALRLTAETAAEDASEFGDKPTRLTRRLARICNAVAALLGSRQAEGEVWW